MSSTDDLLKVVYPLDTLAGAAIETTAAFWRVLPCQTCSDVALLGCFNCEQISCPLHFCEHMEALYFEWRLVEWSQE